jgi:hypothetical protein
MDDHWVCWRCGADLAHLPRPYGRHAQCPACRADLHVCLMCKHHDTSKAKQCRELAADEVQDKTRANPCEWFQARPDAHLPAAAKTTRPARRELDALFGIPSGVSHAGADSARKALTICSAVTSSVKVARATLDAPLSQRERGWG